MENKKEIIKGLNKIDNSYKSEIRKYEKGINSRNEFLKVSLILIVLGFSLASGLLYLKYTIDVEQMQLRLALSIKLAEVNTNEARNLMCKYSQEGINISKRFEVKIFQKFDKINFEDSWYKISKEVC